MNPLLDSKHFELTALLNKPQYIEKEVQREGTSCLETLTTKERYSLWTHYRISESYGHYLKDLNLLCYAAWLRGQLHEDGCVASVTRTGPSVTLQHTDRATDKPTTFYESSASNWGNNTGHTEEFEGYI